MRNAPYDVPPAGAVVLADPAVAQATTKEEVRGCGAVPVRRARGVLRRRRRHRGHTLHQAFPERRVNKVNPRREFFYATPEEVLDVLRQHVGEVLSYTAEPEAEEYRISIGRKDASF